MGAEMASVVRVLAGDRVGGTNTGWGGWGGGRGGQSACVGAGEGLGSILRTLRGCGPGWGINNLSALLSLCSVTVLTFLL